jgi:LuxR family maltose regulon positive regulatory protein
LQRIAEDWQLMDLLVRGELLTARLGLAKGDLPSAELSLQKVESMIEQEGLANHTPGMIALRVHVWLAQMNLVEAGKWAAQTTLSPEAWNPLRKGEVLMLERVFLAQQQYTQAIETLERFREHLDCSGDIYTALEFLALSVVALHQLGKREQAIRFAVRLLQLSEPEGHIRVYLDAGLPMKHALFTLLKELQETESSPASVPISRLYVSRVLEAFEQEQRRAIHGKDSARIAGQRVPNEPLSRQEQRVLRLLVAGQTYTEMAEALVVSPNTIKTQISSIYRKLGVSRRAEAIAVAAHLHLL